jgi:hypothetical protein
MSLLSLADWEERIRGSQFTMSINPANQGVRLSRIMDHGVANQKARVYVNNAQVGTWYTGGVNLSHKARYDSFEIPASYIR